MKSDVMSLLLCGLVFAATGMVDADEDTSSADVSHGSPESVIDAWWRLEDCLAAVPAPGQSPPPARWAVARRCGRLVRIVAWLGDESDRERLWMFYDDHIGNPPLRDQFLGAFLDWHIAHAIEELKEGETRTKHGDHADSAGIETPEWLAGAPAAVQGAWRLYEGFVRRAMEDLSAVPEGRRISFQEHTRSFERTIGDFLRGRQPAHEAVRRLVRFEWRGGCGCGSGALHDPRARALMVAHLQRGRPGLAARVAFLPGVDMTGVGELLEDWERRLLQAAGLDWERFALGAVVAGQAGFAADLGRHGSEDAAQLLLGVLDVGHPYRPEWRVGDQAEVLSALAAFVGSPGSCSGYDTTRADDVERAFSAPVVMGDLEQEVLEALAERTRLDAGRQEADAASHLLLRLCRPESLEAFGQMRRSPFFEVRRRGTIGLRALGERVPDVGAEPPVGFRIVLDGRPLPTTPVEANLGFDYRGVRIRSATTTVEGLMYLERDLFLDPRAPVEAVVLSAGRSPEEVRFSVSLRPPEDLDLPTTVRIPTGRLSLIVPEWVMDGREEAPSLFMRRVARDDDRRGHHSFGWFVPVAQSPIVFSRLQHGTYIASLYFRDGTLLESPEVTVSERPATAALEDATPDYSHLELAGL